MLKTQLDFFSPLTSYLIFKKLQWRVICIVTPFLWHGHFALTNEEAINNKTGILIFCFTSWIMNLLYLRFQNAGLEIEMTFFIPSLGTQYWQQPKKPYTLTSNTFFFFFFQGVGGGGCHNPLAEKHHKCSDWPQQWLLRYNTGCTWHVSWTPGC